MLEAALLFPVLLSATVALMFVGLYAGVQSLALSTAGIAAERAAFSWDNSHRNPVTGAFFPGQYDDLYWRLTGDFPGAALARRKMEAALVTAGPASDGVGRYENAVWRRAVAAGWTAPFRAPDLTEPAGEAGRKTQWSEAFVADPAEWVRTIGLARHYWPLVERFVTNEQAERMVDEFLRRPGAGLEAPAFRSHAEAVDYLQRLVGGRVKQIATEETGHYRRIEAYDRHGIAHHAYLGAKTADRDMLEQLLKDEELMRKGLVKGVVWHFFRRADTGAIGPSEALRKELEKRGIVIVVHE